MNHQFINSSVFNIRLKTDVSLRHPDYGCNKFPVDVNESVKVHKGQRSKSITCSILYQSKTLQFVYLQSLNLIQLFLTHTHTYTSKILLEMEHHGRNPNLYLRTEYYPSFLYPDRNSLRVMSSFIS